MEILVEGKESVWAGRNVSTGYSRSYFKVMIPGKHPANELKRIFRRFYRAPDIVTTRVKGTGLGLFIVRSVIKRHGGKVFAESAGPGQGSTFTIQLPAAPPS